jgi:hypothetical protein
MLVGHPVEPAIPQPQTPTAFTLPADQQTAALLSVLRHLSIRTAHMTIVTAQCWQCPALGSDNDETLLIISSTTCRVLIRRLVERRVQGANNRNKEHRTWTDGASGLLYCDRNGPRGLVWKCGGDGDVKNDVYWRYYQMYDTGDT